MPWLGQTTRKIFTTVYSVFRNPANRLSMGQWGGCGMVFLGMLMDILFQVRHPSSTPPPNLPLPCPLTSALAALSLQGISLLTPTLT